MPTPAQRYAAARARHAEAGSALRSFRSLYDFPLDDFQEQACRALLEGHGVLVAAPTGSGKTLVGEFAVHLALEQGKKCFYTTPIKALSNQKFADLTSRYGPDQVGLLTGDNSLNGEAPIVVMTTEVLRNMLYDASPTLEGLGFVVMDEVHYLANRERGPVWEEVILHLPESVAVVSLSATVSNAEEFGSWLTTVRGDTTVIVEEHRPVPLWQHLQIGHRLYDLFAEETPASSDNSNDDDAPQLNPYLLRVIQETERGQTLTAKAGGGRARRDGISRGKARYGMRGSGLRPPSRISTLSMLDSEGLLPAIVFIFSRVGCESALRQCLAAGARLTTEEQTEQISHYVATRTRDLPNDELEVLGYYDWLDGLERGLACHHAGMLPTFKEVVEELFVQGLLGVVFATETLALGINMPARSVVLERLVKFNGEAHVDLTPGEYTQLTGRAGRRGIDVEGHAVVQWSPGLDPRMVAGLASTRTYPLRSSFAPSYNMAVNLLRRLSTEQSQQLLRASFAQFQADRAVVGLARQVDQQQQRVTELAQQMACDRGDIVDYLELRQALADHKAAARRAETGALRAEAVASLRQLTPGDVIRIPQGRRAGLAVILDPGLDEVGDPRPLVLTINRQVKRLSILDFPQPVAALGRVRIPRRFNARSPHERRDLASSLRVAPLREPSQETQHPGQTEVQHAVQHDKLEHQLAQHPCHRCPDRDTHLRWASAYQRLTKETARLQDRVGRDTASLARQFDRVCSLLAELGYLKQQGSAFHLTAAGEQLSRIYSERDLLVAQCLRHETWRGLSAPELAACVSLLVFESRQDHPEDPRLPTGKAHEAISEMMRQWQDLHEREAAHGVELLPEPDAGFAWVCFRWASGHSLAAVLRDAGQLDSGLHAGDFVRWMKQVLDVLGQIAQACPDDDPVHQSALDAMECLRRGVVTYTSLG